MKLINNNLTETIFNNACTKKEISIFRTSVIKKQEIILLKGVLDNLVGSNNWGFDLEDCDKILRIKSYRSLNNFLCQEINKAGFTCQEIF